MTTVTELLEEHRVTTPNVTPMIDVMLVLLIIYMMSLTLRTVIPAQVPPPPEAPAGPGRPQIVLELLPGSGFAINGQPVADAALDVTLRQLYAERPVKLIFIKAAPDRIYQEVVSAMDRSRGAGVTTIGMVPE